MLLLLCMFSAAQSSYNTPGCRPATVQMRVQDLVHACLNRDHEARPSFQDLKLEIQDYFRAVNKSSQPTDRQCY